MLLRPVNSILACLCVVGAASGHLPHGTKLPEDLEAPGPGDKVVIVGGGIAGIHMARQLSKVGVRDVTIIEKTDRICGKIQSPVVDGVVHDLAAILLGTRTYYSKVYDLAETLNLSLRPTPEGSVGAITDDSNGTPIGIPELIITRVLDENPSILDAYDPTSGLTIQAFTVGVMFQAFQQYQTLHFDLMGQTDFNVDLPTMPQDETLLTMLSMTAQDFVELNGLSVLRPVFEYLQTGNFYGKLELIPAYYLLLWSNPALLGFLFRAGDPNAGTSATIDEGYEALCLALYNDFLASAPYAKVVLDFEVVKITRGSNSNEKVSVKGKGAGANGAKKIVGDFLILAVEEPAKIRGMETEAEIFGRQQVRGCQTLVVETLGNPTNFSRVYFFDQLAKDVAVGGVIDRKSLFNPGPVLSDRNQTLFISKDDGSLEDLAVEEITELLQTQFGYTDIAAVYENRSFPVYFPSFTSSDVHEKMPWRVFGIQGYRNTWYIGGTVYFEAVNEIFKLNDALLERAGFAVP